MNKLTPELQKIVENATLLSLEQRAMIQHHWQSQKELPEAAKLNIFARYALPLVIPSMIAMFVLSMFSEQWGPVLSRFTDALLLFIWLFVIILFPGVAFISHLMVCDARTKKDKKKELLLNSVFISSLRKKNKFKNFYDIAICITLAIVVAMSGSLFTAFFLVLAVILTRIFSGARQLALLATVKEETAEYLLGDGSVQTIDV